jgi:hypothetical protein
MRSNDRYRALWRRVAAPADVDADLDALATRISLDASLALRARVRWTRAPLFVGIAAVLIGVLAVSAMPRQPQPTLLGAVSGEIPARTFEVATVGPRDGAWLIAAAVGKDR